MTTVQRNILLVGSSGGHLTQLWALRPWWKDHRRTWVCFDTPDATSLLRDEDKIWAYSPTTRHIPNLLRNAVLAWKTVRSVKPDIIVSTGAGTAVPFFIVARLLRIPSAFIEVYDRLDSATLTGRLCRPFASVMCVQWEEQRALYRGSVVIGQLL
jgi:UDP-N-acetylglucosamine:LPS N-acetylglucosamine transferase